MSQIQRGVYFLANDRLIELVIAFLNSFRETNPEIPLCLIPYDENYTKIAALKSVYNFTVFDDFAKLKAYDQMSQEILGGVNGTFRKLAAWEGPFDEFIYLDIDTVILKNLDFIFDLISEFPFICAHSHHKRSFKWVWKNTIKQTPFLTSEQTAYAANTGLIASKKGLLSLEYVRRQLPTALLLKPHMCLAALEQPFFNYLIVTAPYPYTSLSVLFRQKRIAGQELWAGKRRIPASAIYLHWAGQWQARWIERIIYRFVKKFNLIKNIQPPLISLFMPHEKIWRHYRYLNSNRRPTD